MYVHVLYNDTVQNAILKTPCTVLAKIEKR